MNAMRILSPTAILGYGFPEASLRRGFAAKPDVIGLDAGSTDPGPYYLGEGKPFVPDDAVERDLDLIIPPAVRAGIPVVIGTAGGSGARPHLDVCCSIVKRILKRHRLHPRVAVIPADIDKRLLKKALRAKRVRGLANVPKLTPAAVDASTYLVGQMGPEPLMEALQRGAEIVIAGRCYDPAVFAALPLLKGYDPGLAIHLGKIVECAAIAATPGSGRDCVLGLLDRDSFRLKPLSSERRFTVDSVAAHTLYEKSDPYILPGPGGHIDLRHTQFRQVTPSEVEVSGTAWVPEKRPTVKVEGARCTGYRTVSIAGVRDPIMLRQLDAILDAARTATAQNFRGRHYRLMFRVYGRDGVMGASEPIPRIEGHEAGLVIDAVADTQAAASAVCGYARSTLLHYGYPGRISTAGNLAFPFSPSDMPMGRIYEFAVYHLMEADDPAALFPVSIRKW